jgi:very-short-patch-repair endonuclease
VLEKVRITEKIRSLAPRQHGHVTRAQLLGMGLTKRAITYRIEVGELVPVHAGVYAVGYARLEPIAKAAAAVLACGDGAALSHSSAASLWGMRKRWEDPIEVTVLTDRKRAGIRTWRRRVLPPEDIRHHHGIPVTSPARTALDIAPQLTARALARAVNEARLAGYLHQSELNDVLTRNPRHPGATAIQQLIGKDLTRSELEDDFVAFAERFGLPKPVMNARVAGYEVDALFAQQRVIVELDGYEFHKDRGSFESDRERDAITLQAGYPTVRITRRRIHHHAEREAARLQGILNRR